MPRVLLVAATTGYQVRSFASAAQRIGVDLILATDRCHVLADPWKDQAVPIRFHDETASVQAITDAAGDSLDGVLAVGDRPAEVAASAAAALGLRLSSPDAVRAAGNKLATRRRMYKAGLACPVFSPVEADDSASSLADRVGFPCVVKPLALSASQGVVRANTPTELEAAMARTRRVLTLSETTQGAAGHPVMLVEQYVPGEEVALEGVLTRGELQVFAVFDKPDPLEGPFFEETIYVTPTALADARRQEVVAAVERTVVALGLTDGPIHAECRLNGDGVFVLEVAARPIGGRCSKALRFRSLDGLDASLEEVLLRHAIGESVADYRRADDAAGVMMIPVPREGRFRGVDGVDRARDVRGIDDVEITAKRDQQIRPLPEGGSYVGFIFARSEDSRSVVSALREAHALLRFGITPSVPVSPANAQT